MRRAAFAVVVDLAAAVAVVAAAVAAAVDDDPPVLQSFIDWRSSLARATRESLRRLGSVRITPVEKRMRDAARRNTRRSSAGRQLLDVMRIIVERTLSEY